MSNPIRVFSTAPRPKIQVGDFVQHRGDGRLGVVRSSLYLLEVVVVGDRSGYTACWFTPNVDLIHGTIRITERL